MGSQSYDVNHSCVALHKRITDCFPYKLEASLLQKLAHRFDCSVEAGTWDILSIDYQPPCYQQTANALDREPNSFEAHVARALL